jgi:hypothetical protein
MSDKTENMSIYTLTIIVQQETPFRSRLENPDRDAVSKTRRNLAGSLHWPLLSINRALVTTLEISAYNFRFDTIQKASEHFRVFRKCS